MPLCTAPYLEYFCAADFVQQFNVAKTLDIDGLIALFDQHCRDDDWREVLRLICGQIDETFVGRVPACQHPSIEEQRFSRPPRRHLLTGQTVEIDSPRHGRLIAH